MWHLLNYTQWKVVVIMEKYISDLHTRLYITEI